MKKIWFVIFIIAIFLIAAASFIFFINKKASNNVNLNFSAAIEALNKGNYLEAKKLYKKVLEEIKDENKLNEIQKTIEDINIKILFSQILDECSTQYVVKPSDSLAKIAKEFNTTVELIKRANNLKSDVIQPKQKLKVNTCKFSILIDKSQNLLFLKRAEEIIKTYVVSTGKNNSTPVGNFKIITKLTNPTWFKAGAVIPPDSPENILGSRWLGFNLKGYGIHGTTEPDNLGKQVTSGCIRMRNSDVEELYDIVPEGAEVVVVD
ncbi:MAG: L,D-transpeptidase family protein [Candidatus Omnitrophica bacterium]|nr:L,D-transpeptidase family protein [Candidatus Omnitrophota bacterium]